MPAAHGTFEVRRRGVIRLARHRDLERLQRLELAAGAPFRELGMDAIADDEPPSIESLASFQRGGRAWVAVDQSDAAVAYLLVAAIDGEAHIEQVSVHPAWGRRRLGSDLIETAAEWARANALPALTLTTFDQVPWNRPYYERLGFEVVDERTLGPGLRAVRAGESERGLDRWPRVVMRRPIGSERAQGLHSSLTGSAGKLGG